MQISSQAESQNRLTRMKIEHVTQVWWVCVATSDLIGFALFLQPIACIQQATTAVPPPKNGGFIKLLVGERNPGEKGDGCQTLQASGVRRNWTKHAQYHTTGRKTHSSK